VERKELKIKTFKGGASMRKLGVCAIVVFLFLFSAQTALPEGMHNKVGFGVKGGFGKHMMADKDVWRVGPFGNAEVKFGLHKNIMVGLIGTYGAVPMEPEAEWSVAKSADEQHNFLVDLATWIYLMPENRFNPYLDFGAGVYSWYVQDEKNNNVFVNDLNGNPFRLRDQQLTLMFGAGFEYVISEYFSLDFGGRFHYLTSTFSQMTKEKDLPDTLLGLPDGLLQGYAGITLYYPLAKDSDKDGVIDKDDKCPNTPYGCLVDEHGCPLDSDGDGVCDGLDQCPNTPRGCKVDMNGCKMDSDRDGVCDGLDKCPNTPAGMMVNSRGCPDTDGDGVYDDEDRCPNTPKGCKVDRDGCPIDSDNDGICDGLDKCPNTPKGMSVDASGCGVVEEIKVYVTFPLNLATLDNEDMRKLDEIYDILAAYLEMRIEVSGHADSTGNDAINDPLSQRRADAVKKYLVKKGVDPDRLVTKGYGSRRPIATNQTKEGRRQNRRAQFEIIR